MGDYYVCAFRVLAVFRQLLTHGQKFDPESLVWADEVDSEVTESMRCAGYK